MLESPCYKQNTNFGVETGGSLECEANDFVGRTGEGGEGFQGRALSHVVTVFRGPPCRGLRAPPWSWTYGRRPWRSISLARDGFCGTGVAVPGERVCRGGFCVRQKRLTVSWSLLVVLPAECFT